MSPQYTPFISRWNIPFTNFLGHPSSTSVVCVCVFTVFTLDLLPLAPGYNSGSHEGLVTRDSRIPTNVIILVVIWGDASWGLVGVDPMYTQQLSSLPKTLDVLIFFLNIGLHIPSKYGEFVLLPRLWETNPPLMYSPETKYGFTEGNQWLISPDHKALFLGGVP